jgi:lipopolysaccharide transport system permease protein
MFSLLVSVWRWRRLVKELARRELRSRYAGSVLGGAWAVLEPAVQFLLYFTVFSYFLGMRLEEHPGVGSYALYLVSGLVPFQMLQECLLRAAGFARAQAGLVRHVNVPLEVLLTGALAAVAARHLLSLALVAAAAIMLGSVALAQVPLLLAGLATLAVGTLGLAFVLVPAGAFLPDIVQVVGTVTSVLFFLTPIVYPIGAVPEAAARWIAYNPLVGVMTAVRAGFLGIGAPATCLVFPAAVATLALLAGGAVFVRRAGAVRDIV